MPSNAFLARSTFYRIVFIVATVLLFVAPSAVRWLQGFPSLSGLFSDIFCALFVALIAMSMARVARFIFLILWMLTQIGSFMLLGSMARLPSWQDLHFVGNGDFVSNSLSNVSNTQIIATLIFLLAVVAVTALPRESISKNLFKSRHGLINSVVIIILIASSLFMQKFTSRNVAAGENIYALYNPLHWLGAEAIQILTTGSQSQTAEYMQAQDLSGQAMIAQANKGRNVLIIAMEGMSGLYLKQARDHFAITTDNPPTLMPRLSKFSEQGMVVPDFLVHTHQTIRGLYSLLCADADKLTTGTPKAVELQNAPARAAKCLPTALARQGYQTHFLQGAGLAFMGKDRIMPALGFQHVYGTDWFKGKTKPHVNFGWGMDDVSFFEGSLIYIDELEKNVQKNNGQPWFLTLLTVGTHQPYAIPEGYDKQYKDRRDAAVGYIDEGVTDLLEALKQRGTLDNTLVIVTSDESQGYDMADWVSAWGINIVFAPEKNALPKINTGNFAISDIPLSIMDYLGLSIDKTLAGRSFFRAYENAREMVSNTAGRLRWLKTDGTRVECSPLGSCKQCKAKSIIGWAECSAETSEPFAEVNQKALWLDASVKRDSAAPNVLDFANGEKHNLSRGWKNAWMDNLIGAQYLDFPANSKTVVKMRWRALSTNKEGGKLLLMLKQFEKDIPEARPELPVFYSGEEKEFSFTIDNRKERTNFSFHLLADSPMNIEMLDFIVTIVADADQK